MENKITKVAKLTTELANDTMLKLRKSAALRGIKPEEAIKIIATRGLDFYARMVGATKRTI